MAVSRQISGFERFQAVGNVREVETEGVNRSAPGEALLRYYRPRGDVVAVQNLRQRTLFVGSCTICSKFNRMQFSTCLAVKLSGFAITLVSAADSIVAVDWKDL